MTAQPYDEAYWENYCALDMTPCGEQLTAMRKALVDKFWKGDLVDVGIGGGRFAKARNCTYGFDINPQAVIWLRRSGLWRNPYKRAIAAATFWDSLEHIHDPGPLLDNVKRWVFLSTPIYADCADVLRSKHFKRDEHCWYFTRNGIERFMATFGFYLVGQNAMEQAAGREQIESFVFRRRL